MTTTATDETTSLRRARDLLIDALGRQSAFWGLGKAPGEIYAALYLSDAPLSLAELAEALGVAKGSASVAARPLEQMGLVHRSWRRGDRRIFFEAEGNFWRIAHDVLALRQKPEFDASFRLVEEAERLLAATASDSGAGPAPAGEGGGERGGERGGATGSERGGERGSANGAIQEALRRVRALRAFYTSLDNLVVALTRMEPQELEQAAAMLAQLARTEGSRT